MQSTRRKPSIAGLCVALVVFSSAATVWACSVPVFRYALEQWTADPYELLVYHDGTIDEAEQQARQAELKVGASANLELVFVNLQGEPTDLQKAIWQEQESQDLPRMVLRYPKATGLPFDVWSGSYEPSVIPAILESPGRQEIAKRLVEGQTAVWVLLESGDQEADEMAAKNLAAGLERAEAELDLPEIAAEDIEEGLLKAEPEDLKIDFSTIRLSRDEAAERYFVAMLEGSELDLKSFEAPLAFPVFGRGRVLYALVGEGIGEEIVLEACQELVGPCTCQVKDQNPGTDIVMKVDWDLHVVPQIAVDNSVPPVQGLGGFTNASAEVEDNLAPVEVEAETPEDAEEAVATSDATIDEPNEAGEAAAIAESADESVAESAVDDESATAASETSETVATTETSKAEEKPKSSILMNTIAVLLVCAVFAGVASFVVLRTA